MRRLLNQLAHAAVKKDGCCFQILFRRWLPRLGYKKAIWAVAHRLCRVIWKVLHDAVPYVEKGLDLNPMALRKKRWRLVAQLRQLS
jgi:transposase